MWEVYVGGRIAIRCGRRVVMSDCSLSEVIGCFAALPAGTGYPALPILCFSCGVVLFQGICDSIGGFDSSCERVRSCSKVVSAVQRKLVYLLLEYHVSKMPCALVLDLAFKNLSMRRETSWAWLHLAGSQDRCEPCRKFPPPYRGISCSNVLTGTSSQQRALHEGAAFSSATEWC